MKESKNTKNYEMSTATTGMLAVVTAITYLEDSYAFWFSFGCLLYTGASALNQSGLLDKGLEFAKQFAKNNMSRFFQPPAKKEEAGHAEVVSLSNSPLAPSKA